MAISLFSLAFARGDGYGGNKETAKVAAPATSHRAVRLTTSGYPIVFSYLWGFVPTAVAVLRAAAFGVGERSESAYGLST